MREEILYAITNLGDSAVTGALALSLTVYLLVERQKRAALAVAASFCLAALVITLGKIVLYSRCVPASPLFDLLSPSGHAATSVAVYGMGAVLVSSSQTGKWRVIPYLVVAPLVALIAVSRVALNDHTASDVVVGLIVGLMACWGAWLLFARGERVHCRWKPFFLIGAIVFGLLYGLHLPAENFIFRLSDYIRMHMKAC